MGAIAGLLIGCTVFGTICGLAGVVISARVMMWNAQQARRNEVRDNANQELATMTGERDYWRSRAGDLERELRERRGAAG